VVQPGREREGSSALNHLDANAGAPYEEKIIIDATSGNTGTFTP
jgi:hypothetical protein